MSENPNSSSSNPASSAETLTTDSAGQQQQPTVVSYDRFKQINEEKNNLAARLAAIEQAENARKQAEQIKNGEFQAVIDQLKPQAERAAQLEATVKLVLDAELADIPEDKRALVPPLETAAQLQWVKAAKRAGLFAAPRAPETHAGVTGDRPAAQVRLSPEQEEFRRASGMTTDDYIKYMLPGDFKPPA